MPKTKITLKDALNNLDKEDKVAIGTRDGHGFMYIGDITGAIENVSRLFNTDHKRKILNKQRTEAKIRELAKVIPEDADILDYASSISDEYNTYVRYKEDISSFYDPMERYVCNTYTRDLDAIIAIIIEGREHGPIWLESEYDDPKVNINLVDTYSEFIDKQKG